MSTFVLVVSLISLVCSLLTLVVVLALLGRKDFAYATKADLERLANELGYKIDTYRGSQSQLYRYVEAVDEHLGANGHRVLLPSLPGQKGTGGDR